VWTAGWSFLLLHYSIVVLESRFGSPAWLFGLGSWSLSAAALAFLYAVQVYSRARTSLVQLVTIGLFFAAWAAVYAMGRAPIGPRLGVVLIFILVARYFWKEGRRRETHSATMMCFAFLLWASILLVGMYFAPGRSPARLDFAVLAGVPGLLTAVLMAVAVFEEEKQIIEHNLLALSNLNLASLSLMGSEIEKTLGQALQCVLGVQRRRCMSMKTCSASPIMPAESLCSVRSSAIPPGIRSKTVRSFRACENLRIRAACGPLSA
jgi:hypothetical protein